MLQRVQLLARVAARAFDALTSQRQRGERGDFLAIDVPTAWRRRPLRHGGDVARVFPEAMGEQIRFGRRRPIQSTGGIDDRLDDLLLVLTLGPEIVEECPAERG